MCTREFIGYRSVVRYICMLRKLTTPIFKSFLLTSYQNKESVGNLITIKNMFSWQGKIKRKLTMSQLHPETKWRGMSVIKKLFQGLANFFPALYIYLINQILMTGVRMSE